MNKTAIKNFAIEARKKLINEVTFRAGLVGITKDGVAEPTQKGESVEFYDFGSGEPHKIEGEHISQRRSLAEKVNKKGFDNVVEEVAYTWFNRIIAIRFMEVNDYLPTRVRVLSSETRGKIEPDIVTEAPNLDLGFTRNDKEEIYQFKQNNQLDDLFRMLFIKQCNELNKILPELFEKTSDYTELLLSISFTNKDSVVRLLVDSIEEMDFLNQVEIVGWMYQYYNTDQKAKVDLYVKKSKKVVKEDVPAKTQLFTPDWIVRYLVDNSLGQLWMEGHPDSQIVEKMKYYLEEAKQTHEVQNDLDILKQKAKVLKPEELTVFDPSMGSGHVLVYAFDLLMEIYISEGYDQREAAKLILQKNLYGIDIDDRAYQLSYFALMMRGRKHSRRIFSEEISPNLCSIQESNQISTELIEFVSEGDTEIRNDLCELKDVFGEAKEFGSILNVRSLCFEKINKRLSDIKNGYLENIFTQGYSAFFPLVKQATILSQKYDVVVTNPPYLSSSDMNWNLSEYVKKRHPNAKSDMFAVFIEKGFDWVKPNGYNAMVTMQSWMFLSSYEKFRKEILRTSTITKLLHMENNVMPIAFGTAATIFRKVAIDNYAGMFNHIETKDVSGGDKPSEFPVKKNRKNVVSADNLSKIPGIPIAYWVSDSVRKTFVGKCLKDYSSAVKGLDTCDNAKFVRDWFEIELSKIGFTITKTEDTFAHKWFPYSKGGGYRKWFGFNEKVVNWENDGKVLRNLRNDTGKIKSRPQNTSYYFRPGITWSTITSYKFSTRQMSSSIFGGGGSALFTKHNQSYLLALLNSKVSEYYLNLFNPTLNFLVGDILSIPIIFSEKNEPRINEIVEENVLLSKSDWNSFETSWDFTKHPLIECHGFGVEHHTAECDNTISSSYKLWLVKATRGFEKLKSNEEELNRIFIGIYGLQDELTPEVEDRDVTVNKTDLERDIKSFISYAVGCMFGRYSLDVDGLAFVSGYWDSKNYKTFIPDADNVIPITDEEYFNDDIVGRFVNFVDVVYGSDTLEENLDFVANALGIKGNTARDKIRNYFIKDFYKDHVKTYKKKPIYWLFDSGKENGFKALIYMHRYDQDTVGRVWSDYLHKMQKALEGAIASADMVIESAESTQKAKAVKEKEKLVKQLAETRAYDPAIRHIATQRIAIDLDDGVTVNYAKFQDVEVSNEGKKTIRVNLLGKI